MADDTAYVALGSNIGDRAKHLSDAITRIEALLHGERVQESSIEETEPLGSVVQEPYLNQMVKFRTALTPRELLHELQNIERAGGRERSVKWGPRTIDLDIVMFHTARCEEPDLRVPHPEIANRPFWQRELAELGAPGYQTSNDSAISPKLHMP